jgi:hypothetical protein
VGKEKEGGIGIWGAIVRHKDFVLGKLGAGSEWGGNGRLIGDQIGKSDRGWVGGRSCEEGMGERDRDGDEI